MPAGSEAVPDTLARFEWWGGTADHSYETAWCDPAGLAGVEETRAALLAHVTASDEPFRRRPVHGAVGFSQGAAVITATARDLELRWVLLFSPVAFPSTAAWPDDCRCCVVFDPSEAHADEMDRVVKLCSDGVLVLHHTLGHVVPPRGHRVWDKIKAWRER